MDELIKVDMSGTEHPTVSGRELHAALKIETPYKKWFDRMTEYGFSQGEDFNLDKNVRVQIEGSREVSREVIDHQLTISMAKELCMIQRTEIGRKFRQYFIQIEEAWNKPEAVLARALQVANRTLSEIQMQNAELGERVEGLETMAAVQRQQIAELQPRADYTDRILKNKGLVTISQIAKDYGMSARKMNKKLHELGVQYKQSGQWLLYARYQDKGYTHSATIDITRSDGRPDITMETKWTQRGRLFIYGLLKRAGILPMIERGEGDAEES